MDRFDQLRAWFANEKFNNAHLGATLDEIGDGRAVLTMRVRADHLISEGVAQGGVALAFGDYAGVIAAMTKLPAGHTPARNMSGSFARPLMPGELVRARAQVEDGTSSQIEVKVDIYSVGPDGSDGKRKSGQTWTYAKPKKTP